jgi:phosphoribosylamine--glycine ligase
MKVLVIGSGGREHALVWKLAQSPRVTQLFCAPGNAGIESMATCIPVAVDDLAALKQIVVTEKIDLTVVGPEAPLALGLVDEFRKAKLKVFGPTRAAAQVESSKAFAKELMRRHHIATAAAQSFEAIKPAMNYLDRHALPVVVKADGLAQGKGVVVATTREEARQAVNCMLEEGAFGAAGRRVLIEQFLEGEEATIMTFTDGKTIVPMVAAQDHKRVGDGDSGPNTGGMGAYAPAPIVTPELVKTVMNDVFHPIVEGLSRMGSPYQGVLYAGLMIVGGTPYVLEFNARFGDPETQVVLPLLQTDLLEVFEAVVEHRLDQLAVTWHTQSAACVVMTSRGYPGPYESGIPIRGLVDPTHGSMVFHAGTKRQGGDIVTAGGRVLGVTGIGQDLMTAREQAYHTVRGIQFDGCHFRSDIAHRAFKARS